jgi:hypothetical protein
MGLHECWRAREKQGGEEGGGTKEKAKAKAKGKGHQRGNRCRRRETNYKYKKRGANPTAAYKIKQRAAAGLVEAAVDKVCAELTEAFLLGDCVAADGDFAGNDQCDERAVAVEA